MKQGFLYIMSFCCLLVLAACGKEALPGSDVPEVQGEASLSLTVDTRAVAGTADNSGMRNLMVLLVDKNDVIVKGQIIQAIDQAEAHRKTIVFNELHLGKYVLYAYANNDNLRFTQGAKFGGKDRQFAELTGTQTPVDNMKAKEALLTAMQEISIKVGENRTTLHLLRTVARMKLTMFNHAKNDIKLANLSFGAFNPSTAYLFSHQGEIPKDVKYRNLPPYALNGEEQRIQAGGSSLVYTAYLYEGRVPGTSNFYTFSLDLDVMGKTDGFGFENAVTNTSDEFAIGTTVGNQTYYLYNNNGKLDVKAVSKLDPKNRKFLWKFLVAKNFLGQSTKLRYIYCADNSNQYLLVDGSGCRIGQVGIGGDASGKFDVNGKSVSPLKSDANYVLQLNVGTSGATLQSMKNKGSGHTQWSYFKKVKLSEQVEGVIKSMPVKDQQIRTVDPSTSVVRPLTEILRNQEVNIVLNVYYNEKTDEFSYTVAPWDEGSGDVEFN